MAIDYRLPGVYSHEGDDLRVNVVAGGNARVAFLGQAVGYKTVSERGSFRDNELLVLSNTGLVGQVSVVSESSGIVFVQDTDFTVATSGLGNIALQRKIDVVEDVRNQSSVPITPIAGIITYDLLTEDGYIARGSVTVDGGAVEDEDDKWSIDYLNGTISFVDQAILEEEIINVEFTWTPAEIVQLTGEISVPLQSRYVSKDGLGTQTLKILDAAGQTPGAPDGYLEEVDYIVDYQTGRISRTPTSRIPSYDYDTRNYMYVSYGYCAIRSSESVRVTYGYADNTYSQAQWFSDVNEVFAMYGQPWSQTGEMQSSLSAGVYIASKNGMSQCYCVAVQGETVQAWDTAFQALAVLEGIDIVVPMSADTAIWALARDHITQMKENQDERVAIFGTDGSSNPISDQSMVSVANGLNSPDLWLVGPSSFKFRNPITNVPEIIPGYFAAAGVAGYNSSVMQATPLTQKVVSGLFSANEYKTKAAKALLSSNGVMYVDEVNGQMRIVHGRTTSNQSIAAMESSTVLSKYYIIKTMRRAFANGYIGSQLTVDTPLMVKSAAHSVLLSLQEGRYLSGYSGLSVEQDDLVPTQLNISFSYSPMYPLETIDITFSVDSTTYTN